MSSSEFADAWPAAYASVAADVMPPDVRPVRAAACTVLTELSGSDPKHDGIGLASFTDSAHHDRFHTWLETAEERTTDDAIDQVIDRSRSHVVVADESVMRGADWLEQRWADGGEKFKHMAIALRAKALTPEEFSDRWRNRAGQIHRPGAAATAIPDEVRGRAYVQNHPRPRATGEWAYDALNEVYFDDVDGVRARIEWFADNLRGQAEEDLVSESWFIAVREVPVW